MLKPLGNRVLVKQPIEKDEDDKTASGFVLSKKPYKPLVEAEVTAVGIGIEDKFSAIKVGSKIYYNKNVAFEEYEDEAGEKYWIIEAKEILGIIEE